MLRITRHARNNIRLYGIQEADLEVVLEGPDSLTNERDRWIAVKTIPGRFYGFPLKVVYTVENDDVVVITTYPVKRRYRR